MDWNRLKNLRQIFLSENKNAQNYWNSTELLKQYDDTFAARIGWKWDSVLAECSNILTLPASYSLVDWGAGTGIATRKFISLLDKTPPSEIILIEKSDLAQQYAKQKITELLPTVPITTHSKIVSPPENFILLVSHVMTELSESALKDLIQIASSAQIILWVEPGTMNCSQRLSATREKLLATFQTLAPCTHNNSCPILSKSNTKDWCHHFAKVPSEAFTTSHWKAFSKEMGIDLRSLPTSYLVMSKNNTAGFTIKKRLIGRARNYKGYSLAQVCSPEGLHESKILEKNNKNIIKELKDSPFSYFM